MKNIIEYMYRNIEDKNSIIAEYADYENGLEIKKLKSCDVIKFTNYINKNNKMNNYGKKVGILMNNSLGFVNSFYSLVLNDKIIVAINTKVSLDELNYIIKVNNLKLIISEDEYEEILNKSNIKEIINYNEINFDDYSNNLEVEKINHDFEDIMLISYTSGTSGKFSKPVETTFKNVSFVSEEYNKV